ncbi:MAG: TIGR02996 domain-containing protein [Fimbriiglobus sp.]|jgi:uncharacterized protein (TIGR02996 family)|nr:TIGR02996 domain-containing protein [Fimbriiglobus sp.]
MHDHAAFLAAIVAAPDDDLPRLVYADWLDEQGQPERAEFIRVQCELERCGPDDDRRAALRSRESALLRRHLEAWAGELRTLPAVSEWHFRRGFLHRVTVVAQRFGQIAESLFRLAPTVRALEFTQGSGSVEGLLRTPQLAKIGELGLSRMCTCGRCPILIELRNLFASPLVANLTRLALAADRMDPETTAALVSSPHLTRLRSLDLSQNALGLAGVRVLAAARTLGDLRELNLSDNGISASGGQVVARAPWLAGLRVLNLSRNRLSDTSGRALLNAEFSNELERLELRTNELSGEMKKHLKAKFGSKVVLK